MRFREFLENFVVSDRDKAQKLMPGFGRFPVFKPPVDFKNTLFYHGSPDRIDKFQTGKDYVRMGWFGTTYTGKTHAIFFTPNPKHADFFAQNRATYHNKPIYYNHAVYLNVKNPLDLRKSASQIVKILLKIGIDAYEFWGRSDRKPPEEWMDLEQIYILLDEPGPVEKIKAAEYDAVIVRERKGLGYSVAVFDPNKIEFVGRVKPNNGVYEPPVVSGWPSIR